MADKRVTILPGVRYRQHPTREHGVRFDRYFSIYYRVPDLDNPGETKKVEEGIGWSSQGWTAEKALEELMTLRVAHRTGEGPQTLRQKRAIKVMQEVAEVYIAQRDAMCFSEIFDQYFAATKNDKVQDSRRRELKLFTKWIKPVLGDIPLKDISVVDLQKIKDMMSGKAPRTIEYCLAVVRRQTFNYARSLNPPLFNGENPVSRIKKPRTDNKRVRYFAHEEADRLLAALEKRSPAVRDIALLSLHCGLRASEVFSLAWSDVDINRGLLFIKDTKSGRNRFVPMTDEVAQMLSDRSCDKNALSLLAPKGHLRGGGLRECHLRDPVIHLLVEAYGGWTVVTDRDQLRIDDWKKKELVEFYMALQGKNLPVDTPTKLLGLKEQNYIGRENDPDWIDNGWVYKGTPTIIGDEAKALAWTEKALALKAREKPHMCLVAHVTQE